MEDLTVYLGDCFASIAKAKGFFNYRTLYDDPSNAALRAKRPNPNQLVEDDVVQIPDKTPKLAALTLDGTKKFVLDRRKTKLRILLTNSAKAALNPVSCTLSVDSASFSTATLPGGLIEVEIDPAQTHGKLEAIFKALPPLGAPPADPPAANPPSSPPVIRPSEFRDELPEPMTEALSVTWDLKLGYLEPKDAVRGSLQRLYNLTYPTIIRKDENAVTARFVKGYQAFKKAAPTTGNISDIRDDLATFHDSP